MGMPGWIPSPDWLRVSIPLVDADAAPVDFTSLMAKRWKRAVTFNQRK